MRSKTKLLALFAVFAAIGLVTATGAFQTVEAERTADVEVAGDANALLSLTAGDSELIEDDGNEVAITLDDESLAAGVNLNALTSVSAVSFLEIANNGETDGVEINITYDTGADAEVYFYVTDTEVIDGDETDLSDHIPGSETELIDPTAKYPIRDNTIEVDSGETIDVGIVIDTRGVDESDIGDGDAIIDGDVTITANAS